MHNPVAYKRLTTEIDKHVSDGTLSMPVKYAEAIQLPYLKACINEGMRLHPSVGLNMPRDVPPGGANISGTFFPAGYQVGISPAVVQYDRDVFGADADDFNPDRWLGDDTAQMDRSMLQFGGGTHICIGKNVSTPSVIPITSFVTVIRMCRL